jgi:peptidoglycan/LPS O-acetylase OafA/YrhL
MGVFPGVPIFFFLSGFLISRTYERNPNLSDYSRNRILRLYPGLLACFLVSITLVTATGYFSSNPPPLPRFFAWTVAQLTALQFYNPEFLRAYGCGVLNGSLWTISVELQFYFLTPIICNLIKPNSKGSNSKLFVTIALFAFLNLTYSNYAASRENNLAIKILGISFAPWFYMFLAGMLAQRNFDLAHRLLNGKAAKVTVAYILLSFFLTYFTLSPNGNKISPILFTPLAAAVFSLAYTNPTLSRRLIGHNDISYGTYIYHMPIINFLIETNAMPPTQSATLAIVATACAAFASWRLIEKPCLNKKRNALNPI